MKRILIATLIAGSLLTACVVAPGGRSGYHSEGVMIAPLLPPVVVFDVEPYYFYSDFHYHYTNNSWYYSKSRSGPWAELPRDRYPREVRFKRNDRRHDRGHDRRHDGEQRDGDRYHDNRR